MSADDIIKTETGRNSEPSKDADLAAKGATIPAPYPAEERPSKEKDIKRAQAMLDGRDPDFVEVLEEIQEGKKLVAVAKDGKTLRIHPANLEAHLRIGYQVAADDDHADDLREVDAAKVEPEKAKSSKPK